MNQHIKTSVGVMIIIIITATIFMFAWKMQNNQPEAQQAATQATKPATSKVVQTNDPTVDWQTYTNTAYKYNLKYPKEWVLETKGGAIAKTFPAPAFNSPCNFNAGDVCSQVFIEINSAEAGNFDPGFIMQPGSGDTVSNKINTKIDGENAVGFEYFQANYDHGDGTKGLLRYVYVVNHNNEKFTITYDEEQKGKTMITASDWQNKGIFDQILSTFKFTK
jgi:hypothetical protein